MIHVIFGLVGSGKTVRLMELGEEARQTQPDALYVQPSGPGELTGQGVLMHRDMSVPCFVADSLAEAMPYVALTRMVLIDEAHHFKNMEWVVPTLTHMGKRVYVSFNSGTAALTPWPGAGELLAHGDRVEIRRGTCLSKGCRRNAPFTAPIPAGGYG